MKKQLIALAVATAVSAPVLAQNVNISGRIDTSFGKATNTSNASTTRISSSVLTTNQIVIGGSEDLGGGLKASFNIISGFASDASNETTADSGNDSSNKSVGSFKLGDRGMEVGLSGAFGSIAVGRTAGTMLNSTATSGVTGNIGNLSTLVPRPDNSVSYTTPTMSGVTLRALWAAGTEASPNENKQTELSAQYSNGPVLVRLAAAKYSNVNIAAGANATNVFGTSAASPSALTDSEVEEVGAQVNYNAGFANLNLRIQNRDHKDSGNLSKDFDSYGIGAAIPLGNGLTLAIDYADTDVNSATGDSDVTSGAIIKDLSKRTNVYAAVAKKAYQDTTKSNEKLFAIGVRHAF